MYYRSWFNLDTKEQIFVKDDIEYNHFAAIKDNDILFNSVVNINDKICSHDDYLIMIGWAKISIFEDFKTNKTIASLSFNSIEKFNEIRQNIYKTWKINLNDIDAVDIDICHMRQPQLVTLDQYNLINNKLKKVDTILIPMDYDNLKISSVERINV